MLEFYNLNSKPGDPPNGTADLVDGKLVETGCSPIFTARYKKFGISDGEIYATLADGWTNGHSYVNEA